MHVLATAFHLRPRQPLRVRLLPRLLTRQAAAARSAATRPSGDRATQSTASSAVAKKPRFTSLPLRLTFAW
eukprot:scaffold117936_cov63-Phaeocystis_antarctica.AAC.10